ncbi:hypothetical protein [Acidovorax carolinensis]|uniref:hypothetical protein n=1 Tax=Acidovorax carolinensis TaxID=553814 RepID=UPI00138FF7B5|nr:hypothetical protein [Acidovorax carolinensis]
MNSLSHAAMGPSVRNRTDGVEIPCARSINLMRAVMLPQDHRETPGFNPASVMCGGRQ